VALCAFTTISTATITDNPVQPSMPALHQPLIDHLGNGFAGKTAFNVDFTISGAMFRVLMRPSYNIRHQMPALGV
jgi:hypothetical protein